MKKVVNISFVYVLVFYLFCGQLIFAREVSPTLAGNAANHFIASMAPHMTDPAHSNYSYSSGRMTPLTYNGNVVAYAVEVNPKGIVLISAVTELDPVLAWIPEAEYVSPEQCEQNLGFLLKRLSSFQDNLHSYRKQTGNPIAAVETAKRKWKGILAPISQTKGTSSEIKVNPILHTHWGQNFPFNALLPQVCDCSTAVLTANAGCTATALAQLMKYWEYPSAPPSELNGSRSYSYDYHVTDPTVLANCNPTNNVIHETISYQFPYHSYNLGNYTYSWGDMNYQFPANASPTPFSNLDAHQRAVALLFHDICFSLEPTFGYGEDGTGAPFYFVPDKTSAVSTLWAFGYHLSFESLENNFLMGCTGDECETQRIA
ncbi:MAG: hypothetical protein GXO70_02030 [Acidobacteria bacterium]|nr:hypothetical protein [Acidobacteriota bacterium]